MKPLSEIYKELGIAFTFPIEITDANGNETYYEDSYGYSERFERDDNGYATYFENSYGYWRRRELDANGIATYYESSSGYKRGIPESLTKPLTESKELCAFCDKPDVFLKGLCPICFEDHYGD